MNISILVETNNNMFKLTCFHWTPGYNKDNPSILWILHKNSLVTFSTKSENSLGLIYHVWCVYIPSLSSSTPCPPLLFFLLLFLFVSYYKYKDRYLLRDHTDLSMGLTGPLLWLTGISFTAQNGRPSCPYTDTTAFVEDWIKWKHSTFVTL